MKIKTFLTFILFFICSSLKCQLSLNLRELNYHEFKKYIPDNEFVNNVELNHRGHILEISIINDSEKSISLPLDTLSYALPFTENTKKYYKGEDFIHDPDIFNVLGVYPFVYQKNKFINKEFDMPYHLEIVIPNQEEKGKFKTERLLKIKKFERSK